MKKITKGLCLLLAVVVCLSGVQSVSAKTKYTKAEKKLAFCTGLPPGQRSVVSRIVQDQKD